MYEAERGLFELARGRALWVTSGGTDPSGPASNGGAPSEDAGAALVASVEGLTEDTLALLRRLGGGSLRLVVTEHRARSMGLAGREGREREDTACPGSGAGDRMSGLSLELKDETRPDRLLRLSAVPDDGNGRRVPVRAATAPEAAALALVRSGRFLPAVVSARLEPGPPPELTALLERGAVLRVSTGQIRALTESSGIPVTPVCDAPVPLADAEDARFVLFREERALREHLAILIGDRRGWPDPIPVRLHSACLTGDLFGSLRCDCGEQLRDSLRIFADTGGVLLYLAQEGRSIGLGNKLRAYGLQQEGLDTVEADRVLGFGADERRYDAAVGILRHLDIERVQLLTNNPEKVRALEDGGIRVPDRRPLHGTLNRHNLPYVLAKARRAGHWLGEMLASGVDGGREPGT